MAGHPDIPQFPLTVFYDGSCSVCAREIDHYLRQDHGGRLCAVDITAVDFDPEIYHIPLDAFMYELHAIDSAGRLFRGVGAFQAIWQAFPLLSVYRLLGRIVSFPLIDPFARLFYKLFARIRPFLPRRGSTCSSGVCRLKHTI